MTGSVPGYRRCRCVHLTLEIKLLLGAGKLFLHPLFSKLTALCRRLRLNTRVESGSRPGDWIPGPLHQLLITLIIVGTESPLTGLLLQVLLCESARCVDSCRLTSVCPDVVAAGSGDSAAWRLKRYVSVSSFAPLFCSEHSQAAVNPKRRLTITGTDQRPAGHGFALSDRGHLRQAAVAPGRDGSRTLPRFSTPVSTKGALRATRRTEQHDVSAGRGFCSRRVF